MRARIGFTLALGLAMAAMPAAASRHDPVHAPAPAKAAAEAPAKRFGSDATLRQEMQGIRASVEAFTHYEHGHMGSEQAAALATAIEGHVNTIIANCKLPPDADAALHGIIVPLAQHAGALKQDPADLSHVASMRDALANFDRQFETD